MAVLYTAPMPMPQQPLELITKAVPDPPKKPRKVDEYVARSEVFRPGAGEYLVDCIVCSQTFMNPELPQLKAHLSTTKHKRNSAASTVDGLTKAQQLQRDRLMSTRSFLESVETTILTCKYCPDVTFDVTKAETSKMIKEHEVSAEHLELIEQESVESAKKPTPEISPRLQMVRKAALKKYPGIVDVNANGLYCVPCFRIFTSEAHNLAHTIMMHMRTKRHKAKAAALKSASPDDDDDDILDPPGSPHPFFIDDTAIKKAYELLKSNKPMSGTKKEEIIKVCGRPVAQCTILRRIKENQSEYRNQDAKKRGRPNKAELMRREQKKATIEKIVKMKTELAQSAEMIKKVTGQLDRWLAELNKTE